MNSQLQKPPLGEQSAIDPESLAELRGLPDGEGGELLNHLIDLFLEDAPQAIADLHQALAAADAPAIARLAHTIRGTGGYFGAHRFQALCGTIEVAGRTGDLAPVAGLLACASRELQEVTSALNAERQLSNP
ncbi:MAG TPA: Hpt domain-containing protein [Bryobacteraceae bacterium]|jgi:two-component system sensor histidine kinase BarA